MEESKSLIEQGFGLMGAGMGVVALFLTLMVFVMHATSLKLRKLDAAKPSKNGGDGSKKNNN